MAVLKAIETVYNGYRFRSRLEARWAVFFDALSIKYEYEKEGFDLGDGVRYLPDFWLPRQEIWIEVKGREPSQREAEKAMRLARATKHRVAMVFDISRAESGETHSSGNVTVSPAAWEWVPVDMSFRAEPTQCSVFDDVLWTACPMCGYVDLTPHGDNDMLRCDCIPFDGEEAAMHEAPQFNALNPRILVAYDTARQARFEHGESGAFSSTTVSVLTAKPVTITERLQVVARFDASHKNHAVMRFHSVYLAGKVAAGYNSEDWREELVKYNADYYATLQTDPSHAHKSRSGGIVSHQMPYDDEPENWPVRKHAILGCFDYTGPYVVDLGHCGNGFPDAEEYDGHTPPRTVVNQCKRAIQESDLLFAWIDSPDCYGTLAEIGYAAALGKLIWVASPHEFKDLWFSYTLADDMVIDVKSPREGFECLLEYRYLQYWESLIEKYSGK